MDSGTTERTITDTAEPQAIVSIARLSTSEHILLITQDGKTTRLLGGWATLTRQLASDPTGVQWVIMAWARRPSDVGTGTPQHPTAETLMALRRRTDPGPETPWTLTGQATAIGEFQLIVTLGPPGAPYEWTVQHLDDPDAVAEGEAPTMELAKAAALEVARGPDAPYPDIG